MKEIAPYLTFDGNCLDAMKFYQTCLGGDMQIMTFGETQPDTPAAAKDRIMHARLTLGGEAIMASDTMPGHAFTQGTNVTISVQCESVDELERLYSALGEAGKPTMKPQDTFWGARFGMLTDRFGVHWMFNYDHPKA